MCGIFCEIRKGQQTILEDEQILKRLKNRGPDCIHSICVNVNGDISLYFYGTVLWMQGSKPTEQPIENDRGVLLFNGDIFDSTWCEHQDLSDTEILIEKLKQCPSSEEIVTCMRALKGPHSIIYYDKQRQILYFLRDRVGRNSLLFHKTDSSYVISSVLGMKYSSVEIPANYMYEFELKKMELNLYSRHNSEETISYGIDDWLKIVQQQQMLPDEKCTIDPDVTIDLTDDEGIIKKIEDVSHDESNKLTILVNLLYDNIILKRVTEITALLEKSVKARIETQPHKCKTCIKSNIPCSHCSTGILFSGGLDCTIIALLADKYVPKDQPIDLINVAFMTYDNITYDVPDRKTGRQSLVELKRICPSRNWVFREVNISRDTLEQYQKSIIGDLVYPRRTILDESLGTALWFAALDDIEMDMSPCRVLLIGSGADELFGGYMRHRNAFKNRGWSGLAKELSLDWQRISYRNLARDNRVICDHGRQPRMPYLDEDLIDYVLKLKPWFKCFPSVNLVCGIGDKLMLRLVALFLGLSKATTLPKRALQFGSRIANRKQKGSDLSRTFM